MTYFTVYYGNNEAMMFNAECNTGSLMGRMIELLAPHTTGYTRLELLPMNFVLEHFKPSTGISVTTANDVAAGAASFAPQNAIKSPPFTGAIPFVGLATRAVESYADALLGGPAAAAVTAFPTTTSTSSTSASAAGVSTSAAYFTNNGVGAGPTVPSPALQNCYVLLGCRYHHYHPSPRPRDQASTAVTTSGMMSPPSAGYKNISMPPRKICFSETAATPQQIASLYRAQLIAAATIVPAPNSRGNGLSGSFNGWTTTTPQQGGSPNIDPATLLLYKSGTLLYGASTAFWRKNFSQYLTTLLLPPLTEGNNNNTATITNASPTEQERNPTALTEADSTHDESSSQDNAMLLPSMATGLFKTPTPPITGYDVLWRGTRDEHIRLQETLDEGVFTDTENNKKKKSKKN
ncbi:hypothetical protein C3747_32g40 [Trypanosoma cruzi]|uniref:Uncharacterized protein n=2 Tax=Trypanosoma cruzi TaxID=5693 RepID=Q4E367_TRYCC|nr:hypothetical protein, conserved [Trypanosoma cruzi]AAQ74629.1 unknown [Trypanosoma cruzi]EAN99186.1 hypothetical protein, conserved [Trypanosoma cruzi]PWV14937.1 hypothetical protein C3747_32g40 [Trypanosoma cruzi]|eukprot:XP_821037.1 hypothetical protein [Trypanosoma cruzi strain CL Brener]